LSLPFTVRILSLDCIARHATHSTQADRVVLLPTHDEAMVLVEHYLQTLSPVQHVVHTPTLRRDIEAMYHRAAQGKTLSAQATILLVAILASIAGCSGLGKCQHPVFPDSWTALQMCVLWLRTAMDVLEHIKRSVSATLDTLQAMIITCLLLYHVEGFSPKVRTLVRYSCATPSRCLGFLLTTSLFIL
jgi:hypothetical protein